jgi:hypothetical protein
MGCTEWMEACRKHAAREEMAKMRRTQRKTSFPRFLQNAKNSIPIPEKFHASISVF